MKQDSAPKGGYPEFRFERHLPRRGPSGLVLLLGGAAAMAVGFAFVVRGNKQRRLVFMLWHPRVGLYVRVCVLLHRTSLTQSLMAVGTGHLVNGLCLCTQRDQERTPESEIGAASSATGRA